MLLEVSNLSKEYIRSNRPFFAVRDVHLKMKAGDFAIIIGRSGSGKSTLLNLIGGLVSPTVGQISIDGCNIMSLKDRELSAFRNSYIGYIPQGHSILSNLSVLDNVRLPHYLQKRQGDVDKRALSLLEQFGIAHLANAYPQQLSGGELRRVTIARALMNKPKLLLADEPTNDLDAQTTYEVMHLFSEIANEGTAVLLVTHDLSTIHYGKHVYRMDNGELKSLNT